MIGKNGRSSWERQGITAFCTCQWNEWMNMNLLFCRPSWLISALTKTHHWIVSLASSSHSTPSHPSCLTSVSILFLSIPRSQEWFLWVLMTKCLYACLISFIHVTLLCCRIFPYIIAFIILYQKYKLWSSLLYKCCYFFFLRSKYLKLFFSPCKSVLFPDILILLGERFLLFFKTFFLFQENIILGDVSVCHSECLWWTFEAMQDSALTLEYSHVWMLGTFQTVHVLYIPECN